MSTIQFYSDKIKRRFFTKFGRELQKVKAMPRLEHGTIEILGKPFLFHDGLSFLHSYHEIFERKIYHFNPEEGKNLILDCGANMGLSVLYFAHHYPQHKIIAFEPDAEIFKILQQNVSTYQLANVELRQQAVWNKEEKLRFFTDNGMGGRIGEAFEAAKPHEIEAIRLRELITDGVDFLKIDIEGAEYTVIQDCKDVLQKVSKIFFEYHGHYQEPQRLHEMLGWLHDLGFHYYIKESSTRERPFIETSLICDVFDMAINIFAYRQLQNGKTPLV